VQHPPIPVELQSPLRGYNFVQDAIGQSGDGVFRLEAPQRPSLIVKLAERRSSHRLPEEAARLKWLKGAGIPAPRVLHEVTTSSHDWLVMERLPGTNAADSAEDPSVKVHAIAAALRSLHALEQGACPFDETLPEKVARAEANVRAGRVDIEDFDAEHRGKPAAVLFDKMLALLPQAEDVVVAHGDASLPNMILDAGGFSGSVDCGRLGRSDRYQDLALACHSIRFNLGEAWVQPFLRAYGLVSVDETRMYFYRLLDEFF
jgi:aminoglycoside 3'-phosphotransferase-2